MLSIWGALCLLAPVPLPEVLALNRGSWGAYTEDHGGVDPLTRFQKVLLQIFYDRSRSLGSSALVMILALARDEHSAPRALKLLREILATGTGLGAGSCAGFVGGYWKPKAESVAAYLADLRAKFCEDPADSEEFQALLRAEERKGKRKSGAVAEQQGAVTLTSSLVGPEGGGGLTGAAQPGVGGSGTTANEFSATDKTRQIEELLQKSSATEAGGVTAGVSGLSGTGAVSATSSTQQAYLEQQRQLIESDLVDERLSAARERRVEILDLIADCARHVRPPTTQNSRHMRDAILSLAKSFDSDADRSKLEAFARSLEGTGAGEQSSSLVGASTSAEFEGSGGLTLPLGSSTSLAVGPEGGETSLMSMFGAGSTSEDPLGSPKMRAAREQLRTRRLFAAKGGLEELSVEQLQKLYQSGSMGSENYRRQKKRSLVDELFQVVPNARKNAFLEQGRNLMRGGGPAALHGKDRGCANTALEELLKEQVQLARNLDWQQFELAQANLREWRRAQAEADAKSTEVGVRF